jgi:hypothetical protein
MQVNSTSSLEGQTERVELISSGVPVPKMAFQVMGRMSPSPQRSGSKCQNLFSTEQRGKMQDRRADILSAIDADHGVTAVSMGWLREVYDPEWGRLSASRAAEISRWLAKHEVAHLPVSLPPREVEEVVLYRPSSPVGVYINAARLEGPFKHRPAAAAYFLQGIAQRLSRTEQAETDRD